MSTSTLGLTSCARCGIAFPLGARFCPSCGGPLDASQRPAASEARAAAETRPVLPEARDPLIGKVIAERYRVVAQLGRGGMGVVYRVEHVHIGKRMAMKLLSGELANEPQTLKRFQREAKAISKLAHPNTVQIFDFGESASLAYLVMEYLPGRDLATVIYEDGVLEFERVARIGVQIASSVEEAHRIGIIHRDIKPENVMLIDTAEQRDFVKVLDFGIAKLRDVEDGILATQKGHLVGTPFYMAPEQIRGENIDHRVDVYALGALMYKALSGETPFTAATPMEVLGKVLNEPLVPLRKRVPERAIPVEADRILAKALAKDPDERHATMAELREELLRYLRSIGRETSVPQRLERERADTLATRVELDRFERRILRTHRVLWGAAALGILALAAGAVVVLRARNDERPLRAELEPNDEPSQANLIAPGQPVTAYLGRRRSSTEGDADVYRLELDERAPVQVEVQLSPIPNIDLVLELVKKGQSQPLLSVNSGSIGEPEQIPNVLLAGGSYLLRVREVAAGLPGRPRHPTENVSDAYQLGVQVSPADQEGERELNDSFELAALLTPDGFRDGLIGWKGDKDVYCSAPSSNVRAVEVSGVPSLDLVLGYLDRHTQAGQRIDRRGIGESERFELPASKSEREACFTVSAREREGAASSNPKHSYRISLR